MKEKITPKKKTPSTGLFLLSVLAKKFSPIPTCYLPKEDNWLNSEECKPLVKESTHKNEWLENNS